jgi:hypothetical protein
MNSDLLYLVGFVLLYLALSRWLLPRFGAKT